MHVEVVVPWRDGCPHRSAALDWVRQRYADAHPAWRLHVSAIAGIPWCKAQAIASGVQGTADDAIVVVADADVWCDSLGDAVEQVADGAAWAIPHRLVHRLDQAATQAVLAGEEWRGQPLDQRPYLGVEGGGIVVARKEVVLSIPPDARFVGWG